MLYSADIIFLHASFPRSSPSFSFSVPSPPPSARLNIAKRMILLRKISLLPSGRVRSFDIHTTPHCSMSPPAFLSTHATTCKRVYVLECACCVARCAMLLSIFQPPHHSHPKACAPFYPHACTHARTHAPRATILVYNVRASHLLRLRVPTRVHNKDVHRMNVILTRIGEGSRRTKVRVLPHDGAVDAGGEIVAETVIFGTAGRNPVSNRESAREH